MAGAPQRCVAVRPPHGLLLLTGTVLGSLGLIVLGQQLLRTHQQPLNPSSSPTELWKHYRWAWDPSTRRDAALLLVASDRDSPHRHQRLLTGQAWGQQPTAAAVLLHQARTAERLGQQQRASSRWRTLLRRFPSHPFSADALYVLSKANPSLKATLLAEHPSHPAALERAVQDNHALHLARWGPQHHGAATVLREACASNEGSTNPNRQQLALALALLGDGASGLKCLQGDRPAPVTAVALAKVLRSGNQQERSQGEALLVRLTNTTEPAVNPTTLEAARLLAEPLKPQAALLQRLPKALREQSADVAAAEVRLGQRKAVEVIQRWPHHPASWQLQWDLARSALLSERWQEAATLLQALAPKQLPEPLAARQRFWLGFSQHKQGNEDAAATAWRTLLEQHPPSYYTWRASARLGAGALPPLQQSVLLSKRERWSPLQSGHALVDSLWRLGMHREALETWLSRSQQPLDVQTPNPEPSPADRITAGRLLLANGDTWNGLNALWRVSLRQVNEGCLERADLHRLQHPLPWSKAFSAATQEESIHEALLRAIAKQESRYSSAVRSPVGAEGLMQLMPSTAASVSSAPLQPGALRNPTTNVQLGARYLQQLLMQWDESPWLAVASYNAGPSAAGRWRTDELERDPELWAERIPYPETRIYTKKVLGNLWAYFMAEEPGCRSKTQ